MSQDREYFAPELETYEGLTYGKWKALAVVYGTNVPFLSQLARGVVDANNNCLWSSPELVLMLAEASAAFSNENIERSETLMAAAVDYCNQFLPEDSKLAPNAKLRLTWARFGVLTVTREKNRQHNYMMDVVRHGPDTEIIIAPRSSEMCPIQSNVAEEHVRSVFYPTGVPQAPRSPQRRSSGRSG